MRTFRVFFVSLLVGLLLIACSSQPAPEAPEPTEAPAEEAAPTPAEEASEKAAAEDTTENQATEATAEGFPRTLIDGQGREVTFEAPPQRVMCFYTDCVEGLVGLGLKPAIVPEWFQEFISITLMNAPGGMSDVELIRLDDGTPSAEAIAAAAPDLVMVYSQEEAQALAEVAPTFVTYPVNSIEDVIESLRRYAQIFGLEAEAEATIERFMARRKAYSLLAPGDLRVMNVREDSGDLTGGNLRVRSTSSPDCVLLEEIAQCPWVDPQPSGSWDFQTTVEYLLQEDPDVILISTYGGGNIEAMRQQVAGDPLWRELSAVKNGRLVIIDDDLTADGIVSTTRFLDHVAPALYPDIFPEPLTDEQAQEIVAGQSGAAEEGEAAAEGSPRTITDGEGNELTFAAPPERLVCTYSRCMELLATLELEPVGVTTWEESFIKDPAYFQQPTTTEILSYDGDFPDLERLAALEPDLVFGWQEMSEALAGIVPVYGVADDQDSYAESHEEIRAFAQLLGREEIANRNIQKALDRLAAYKQRSPNNLSVMYGFFSDGTFSYRDGDSGTCNLFKEIARCDWADPTNSSSWSVEVGDEGLLALDPEVLLVDSYGFEGKTSEEIIAEVSTRPLWGELQAVKNGRVYVASDDVANMDGMGTVGMQKMLDVYAPLLYPEVFPEPLTDEQVQEILAEAE